jgi:hypothetical protein
MGQIKKNDQVGLNDEIETNKTFIKRIKEKIKIKRIRTEFEMSTIKREKLSFYGEGRGKKKASPTTNRPPNADMCHLKRKRKWRHFQIHSGRAFFVVRKRCFPHACYTRTN